MSLSRQGEEVQSSLIKNLHPIGQKGVTDVYHGPLSVDEIIAEVAQFLAQNNLHNGAAYSEFLQTQGSIQRMGYYYTIELSDTSQFVLRDLEDDPQYFVHIHPARYSPQTFRTKPNTLKSCIFAHYLSLCRQTSPLAIEVINEARQHLDLSPLPEVPSAIEELLGVFTKEIEKFPLP